MISARTVTAEIARTVWPVLQAAGLNDFTGRTAWRATETHVAIVDLRSVPPKFATVSGCSPRSFYAMVGVRYAAVAASMWSTDFLPQRLRPEESESHVRLRLHKTLRQPEFSESTVWPVGPSGADLKHVVSDAATAVSSVGLPWLERFTNPRNAVLACLTPRSSDGRSDTLIPSLGSLAAAQLGAALGVSVGDFDSARDLWKAVARDPYYAAMSDVQATTAERMRDIDRLEAKAP